MKQPPPGHRGGFLLVGYTDGNNFVSVRQLPTMKAVFIELPAFSRYRSDYLDDDELLRLQRAMMTKPEAGDVIEGTGGLRKLRHGDARRGKGKRGGLRIIYYWWDGRSQFWLFTATKYLTKSIQSVQI
jgi:mRNA-degrading endonuclease RelE of RelBE toxin-antitoxin system